MIKNLRDITDKDIKKFSNNPVTVIEKLDMLYFRVIFNENDFTLLKTPKFEPVNEVDFICNSAYTDIYNYIKDTYYPNNALALKDMEPGFFYLPVHKTNIIDYTTLPEKTFIPSDLCRNGKRTYLRNVIVNVNRDFSLLYDSLVKYKNNEISDLDMTKILVGDTVLPSKMNIENIEGIILDCNGTKYQIILNDCSYNTDIEIERIGRDFILCDFIKTIMQFNDLDYICSMSDYISIMDTLFIKYINTTDLLKKYQFNEADLEPPHAGFLGKVNIDKIHSQTVKLTCRYNEIISNVYRIILHSFDIKNKKKVNRNNLSCALEFITLFNKINKINK